jgi:hypothetical protein
LTSERISQTSNQKQVAERNKCDTGGIEGTTWSAQMEVNLHAPQTSYSFQPALQMFSKNPSLFWNQNRYAMVLDDVKTEHFTVLRNVTRLKLFTKYCITNI